MSQLRPIRPPSGELTPKERREVEERAPLRVIAVHEIIRREGEDQLRRSASALLWSGIAAGLSMGFSLAVQGILRAGLPDAAWRPLVANLGYSVGYLIVILGRQQLFTENTLTVVLPLLTRRDRATLLGVARVWLVVLAANLVGAAIFTAVAARTDVFRPEVRQAFLAIGQEAVSGGSGTLFIRAIFAGWLIALMLWLLPEAETAKVPIIVAITYVVGIGGFAHVIAGTMEVLYAVMAGAAPLGLLIGGYIVPTFLGNAVGGVALVAVLNHAQAFADVENSSS